MLHNPNWKQPLETKLDEVGQHLLRAASYIEEHGWCQNYTETAEGKVCLAGALSKTKNRDAHLYHRSFCTVMNFLKEVPFMWNDRVGRTKDEVVAMLRKAAYSK